MDIQAFVSMLKVYISQTKPNYQDSDAESLLELLYNAYSEFNGFDNVQIRRDFDNLYSSMNGKTLREIDEVIYPVCVLCRDHEKTGFEEGVKVGIRLAQELSV